MLLVVPTDLRPPRGLFCWAWPLCVPVGGSPPARSPHASLRLGVVDLEARPGPAAAHRHRGSSLRCPPHRRCGATTAYPHGGQALLWSLRRCAKPSNAVWPRGGLQSVGTRCLFVARTVPAAAYLHRGRALLWSLRHYANPSTDKRPGPQPHKQTLNNVRIRPVVQCLPMRRCAYPRLGLLVWAVHPIRRHCTRSERVQRHVRGAAPRNGCSANPHEEGSFCYLFHT